MGVDYDGVGGIGIEITDDICERLIKSGHIKEEEYEEYGGEVYDDLNIMYQTAGSANYGGEERVYWIVEGNNLDEINANSTEFIDKLKSLGITIETKDLIVIEDIHVW